jgi:hypothetical protein
MSPHEQRGDSDRQRTEALVRDTSYCTAGGIATQVLAERRSARESATKVQLPFWQIRRQHLLRRVARVTVHPRRAILNSANLVIGATGYDHFPLEAMARGAGVSKGAPLHHFPSKEDLVTGMIWGEFDRYTVSLEDAAARESPGTSGRWTSALVYSTLEDGHSWMLETPASSLRL